MTAGQVENIGTDRQLFLDDHWIDSSTGAERVLHEPVAENIALEAEHPWDQIFSAYHLVLGDGSRWRMYYLCSGRGDEDGPPGGWQYCGYAESDDGIEWTKPELGVVEVDGSKRNNLVYAGPLTEFAPFLTKTRMPPRTSGTRPLRSGRGRNRVYTAWCPWRPPTG